MNPFSRASLSYTLANEYLWMSTECITVALVAYYQHACQRFALIALLHYQTWFSLSNNKTTAFLKSHFA